MINDDLAGASLINNSSCVVEEAARLSIHQSYERLLLEINLHLSDDISANIPQNIPFFDMKRGKVGVVATTIRSLLRLVVSL